MGSLPLSPKFFAGIAANVYLDSTIKLCAY